MTMRVFTVEEFKTALRNEAGFFRGDAYTAGGNTMYYTGPEINTWVNRRGESFRYYVDEIYGSYYLQKENLGGRYSYAGEQLFRTLRTVHEEQDPPEGQASLAIPRNVPEASDEFKAELWKIYRELARHYRWCQEGQNRLERMFRDRLGLVAPSTKVKVEVDLPVEYTTSDLREALSRLAGRPITVTEIQQEVAASEQSTA